MVDTRTGMDAYNLVKHHIHDHQSLGLTDPRIHVVIDYMCDTTLRTVSLSAFVKMADQEVLQILACGLTAAKNHFNVAEIHIVERSLPQISKVLASYTQQIILPILEKGVNAATIWNDEMMSENACDFFMGPWVKNQPCESLDLEPMNQLCKLTLRGIDVKTLLAMPALQLRGLFAGGLQHCGMADASESARNGVAVTMTEEILSSVNKKIKTLKLTAAIWGDSENAGSFRNPVVD